MGPLFSSLQEAGFALNRTKVGNKTGRFISCSTTGLAGAVPCPRCAFRGQSSMVAQANARTGAGASCTWLAPPLVYTLLGVLLIPSCSSSDTRAHQLHHGATAQQGMQDMKQVWQHNTPSKEAMHFPVHSTVFCVDFQFTFYQQLGDSYAFSCTQRTKGHKRSITSMKKKSPTQMQGTMTLINYVITIPEYTSVCR